MLLMMLSEGVERIYFVGKFKIDFRIYLKKNTFYINLNFFKLLFFYFLGVKIKEI